MMAYALKLAGAAILFLFVGILVIWLFAGIWTRVGLITALVVVFGGLVLLAWRGDRKAKQAREGLERV